MSSKDHYTKETSILIRITVSNYIVSYILANSLEFRYTIKLLEKINEIEKEIKSIIDKLNFPSSHIIPEIGYSLCAQLIAEIGEFKSFDSLDKILGFAVMSPSTYQLSKLHFSNTKMEKRGSKY